jgi:transposase InsO family protein
LRRRLESKPREGKVFCAVLDALSRRIVGWSINTRQESALVINALDMAIRNRRPEPDGIGHADHGVRFTSWAFGDKVRSAGLVPTFGSVGGGLDNAMMNRFGPRRRSSCGTARSGRPESNSPTRSSSTSRSSTTANDATRFRLPHPINYERLSESNIVSA